MKKIYGRTIIAAITALTLAATGFAALADEEVFRTGAWEEIMTCTESGYYDVTAEFDNPTIEDVTSLYAYSTATEKASSVVPATKTTNQNANGYSEVMIRGVFVDDGKITVGVKTENESVKTVSVSVERAAEQKERTFFTGGDISEANYVAANGGKYYDFDGTTEVDPIDFLAQNGMNAARIRLSNNPGKGRGDGNYYLAEGYQDLDDCVKLGKKAMENGMTIEFTFNYSDYWSNGERQIIPQDFADKIKADLGIDVKDVETLKSLTTAQSAQVKAKLADIVYEYTKSTMERLKAEGIRCDYVSLGNEINGGMFFPFANTYDAYMGSDFELNFDDDPTDDEDTSDDIDTENDVKCTKDLAALGKILNAGYRAVKEVSPNSKVVVHFAGNELTDNFSWILNDSKFKSSGEAFDVIGISYYPAWSEKTASECAVFVDSLKKKYSKDVIIMETGFNFSDVTTTGYGGQLKAIDAYKDIYPDSLIGHKGYVAEMINAMRNTDGCIGILYWDPLMIHVEDSDGANKTGWAYAESDDSAQENVVENTTMFDFNGAAIDTLRIYNDTAAAVKKPVCEIDEFTKDGAKIKKNSNENTVLIFAGYDENGVLTGVEIEKDTLTEMDAGGEKTVPYNEDVLSNGKDLSAVKVFAWDLDKSLCPICKSREVRVERSGEGG